MFEQKSKTPLSGIGEFGLIEHLTSGIEALNSSTLRGIGDDAAVISGGKDSLLVSTDLLVEGIHFDVVYTPMKHLGYKAVAVNLSDICAMNGRPEQITVSIAVSSKYTLEALEALYEGMRAAASRYNVDIVGGDTTSSLTGLMISITAIGRALPEKVVYRSGARENDLLIVSGDLGGAYMGLQLLEREKHVFEQTKGVQPDLEGNDYILERQLKPEPRLDVIELFGKLDLVPSSMIDISDGLASEVLHICKASGVGCAVYEEKIPIDPMTYNRAKEFNLDPTTCAMNGGEDYELLFTINQKDWEKVKNNPHFTAIGHITLASSGVNLVTRAETLHPITAQGWDSIKQAD